MKIPVQPAVNELAPGELEIDRAELARYTDEMAQFKTVFDSAINGCDPNDPDAIMSALFNKISTSGNK